ncbi:MAG: rhombotarget lipoprotein [Geobacteraceae bacterium]|nr:rhombotarget lipoprotein [Geobacteraceae bacterium]
MKNRISTLLCLVVLSFTALSGCAQHIARSSSSASLAEIFEPIKESRQTARKTPLTLPASVAIVTVPGKQPNGRHVPNTTLRQAAEKLKQQLLASPRYVSSVAVVTEEDIKGRISLEKIRAVYAADIAIILSYQQDQRSTQSGAAGLMDATIVGIFLVPGVELKTASVIDGKVIHIPSNAIVFRASGTDERSFHSTTYARNGNATEESINSILAATTDFGNSLTGKLSKFDNYDFSQAVPVSVLTAGNAADAAMGKPANDYWEKVDNYKSTGGGAFGIIPLLISAAVCCAAWRRK